jgi:hypothetical protein
MLRFLLQLKTKKAAAIAAFFIQSKVLGISFHICRLISIARL